jgi:hypothetical protein
MGPPVQVGGPRRRIGDRRHRPRRAATVLRMAELAVGDLAPDLSLLDADERPVALSSLWKRGPLVVVFLRHFG